MADNNFGKMRVYTCPGCEFTPVRPLYGLVKPCDHCLADLSYAPYVIEDNMLYVRRLLAATRKPPPDQLLSD